MNRVSYNLITSPLSWNKMRKHPCCLSVTLINDEVAGVHMMPTLARVGTLNAVGVSILELSKLLMQTYHYDVIMAKYGDRAKLLYTDTDSLVYHISTPDVFEDLTTDPMLREWTDCSGFAGDDGDEPLRRYASDHNRKVLGRFKYEGAGKVFAAFHGVCAKVYAFEMADGAVKSTAKGTSKSVRRHELYLDEYEQAIAGASVAVTKVNSRFQSVNHTVSTIRQTKVAFRNADDKRYWEGNDSYVWGHPKSLRAIKQGAAA
jgi:hypothetical protein